MSKLQCFALI